MLTPQLVTATVSAVCSSAALVASLLNAWQNAKVETAQLERN
jgi:hypothetical protein